MAPLNFTYFVRRLADLLAFGLVCTAVPTLAQSPEAALPSGTPPPSYQSAVDDQLTLQKITVLPFTDNLEGIYARPLEAYFTETIQSMHRWDFVPVNVTGPLLTPDELEADATKAKQAVAGAGTDAFFAARIIKGPAGVSIHLDLFASADGQLLLEASLQDSKQFGLADLKTQLARLLKELVQRLPYAGRVLSRDGNRVTIDLGLKDDVKIEQALSVVQIVKLQRHPKFNFLVHAEKELIGRIRVVKADDTLSFAVIESEKEPGAIQKNSKIAPVEFVTYASDAAIAPGQTKVHASTPPIDPPKFGQVGARLGLSRVSDNADVQNAGVLAATNVLAPSLTLDGELWLTPEWMFQARLRQGLIPMSNPRDNSSPSTLNQSLTYVEAGFGYAFRLASSVWGPTLEPFVSYFSYRLFVDNSEPLAYTTQSYSGLKLGMKGSTPIDVEGRYGVGGQFGLALNPILRESPVSSGDSAKNTVVQFALSGYRKMNERLRLQVDLEFEMYSSSFTGDGGRATANVPEPAHSSSQRYTTLTFGANYLF